MRHYVRFSVSLIMILSLLLASGGTASAQTEEKSLCEQLVGNNAELIGEILAGRTCHESMDNLVLDNKPMMLYFPAPLWAIEGRELTEFVEYLFDITQPYILILQDEPIAVGFNEEIVYAKEWPIYTYLQDILDGSAVQTFQGQSCVISNVMCYSSDPGAGGQKHVIYETDKGLFVRTYRSGSAPAVEFAWDTYLEIAHAYLAKISSYEYLYDENGNPKAGLLFFDEFAEDYMKQKEAQELADRQAAQEAARQRMIVCTSIGAGVVVLGGGVGTYLLLRRRKKRKTVEE